MLTGGCQCGAVRYRCPGDALFSVICHCRACQKASGTAGVPVMGVAKNTFQVTGRTLGHSVPGGSGRPSVRHFCPSCGSLLFGTPEAFPDFVSIYVGSLDDPGVFRPEAAIFTRERPAWARPVAGLKEYEAAPV